MADMQGDRVRVWIVGFGGCGNPLARRSFWQTLLVVLFCGDTVGLLSGRWFGYPGSPR